MSAYGSGHKTSALQLSLIRPPFLCFSCSNPTWQYIVSLSKRLT